MIVLIIVTAVAVVFVAFAVATTDMSIFEFWENICKRRRR